MLRKIVRYIYANEFPVNIIQASYWKKMIEEVGAFGLSLKQPSFSEIRTHVLKAEIEDIDKIKAIHMAAWKKYRCTMMSDGRTDRKSRSLINFLVNSPEVTFFYKSIDASESIKIKAFL